MAEHHVPEVVLYDLDETMTDRTRSVQRDAERFLLAFNHLLVATTVVEIVEAIVAADECGYRPRESVFTDLRQGLTWLQAPELRCCTFVQGVNTTEA